MRCQTTRSQKTRYQEMTTRKVCSARRRCAKSGIAFWLDGRHGHARGLCSSSSAGASRICNGDYAHAARLLRGNQKKQPAPAAENSHQTARVDLPDHPIKSPLKPRRWRVQQQVSGTEFLAELYLLESLHQLLRFFFGIRICARTLQVIVNRFAQRLPVQPPEAQP